MGIRIELEILAVLLLLTPIASDGSLMSKCELVNQLMSIIPADVTDRENLVAKIVCHAEETSGFDTSTVNQVNPLDLVGRRKTRAAPISTRPPKTTNPPPKSATSPPPKSSTSPPPKSATNPPPKSSTSPPPISATNPPPISATNPPPKSATSPPPKSATSPPPKSATSPPPISATNPPPKSATNRPPKLTTSPPPKSATNPPPNTTQMPKAQPRTPLPKLPSTTHEPMFNETENPIAPPPNSLNTENEMNDAYPPLPPDFNSTYMNHSQKRGVNGLWTLYGVFQLADRVACTSSKDLSVNICNMDCSKLTDDDLTDDINCVLTIINSKPTRKGIPGRQEEANKLIRIMKDILMNTCANQDYSQYLANCIAP
ncbi:circumsporozoite protein-like [Ictalurus furcatus]|uniref:circumsporozoite protein-like n=1 Tax=Ictalurus furcatus TaxID=66913 RepID=UPI00234FC8B8|nr:circumsporozoite protein-like [Ictalurus furcatus]